MHTTWLERILEIDRRAGVLGDQPGCEEHTRDELPALLDGCSDEEDEPVSAVHFAASPGKPELFVASPGKPDIFVPLIVIDEFSCAQDVMAAAFALRHLTLETQSRGKLHMHSISYAVRGDRAESCAYISGSV